MPERRRKAPAPPGGYVHFDPGVETTEVRVKPHSKVTALDQLMRHAGLSKDKAAGALADLAERVLAGQRRIGRAPEAEGVSGHEGEGGDDESPD